MRIRLIGISNRKMTNLGHHFGILFKFPKKLPENLELHFTRIRTATYTKIGFTLYYPN